MEYVRHSNLGKNFAEHIRYSDDRVDVCLKVALDKLKDLRQTSNDVSLSPPDIENPLECNFINEADVTTPVNPITEFCP